MSNASIVICGAGIVGLTIARELVKRGHSDILIIEKEGGLGKHASGRNSGVMHAGIYYAPGSIRAQSCLKGNFLMKEYCQEKGLPLSKDGKVIVARNEDEIPTLKELFQRAKANGAKVELIDEKQLAEIEPNAKTTGLAIHSYYTAVVDPNKILASLKVDLLDAGVEFKFNTKFAGVREKENIVLTDHGQIGFDLFINAAGAYSDKVAQEFGLAQGYKLIPFKGIYRRLVKHKRDMVRGSIYPVPNIKNPFLGVHFTRGVHGDVYLGPTAIPAFGRENYGIFQGLDSEAISILLHDMKLFLKNKKFREVALEEPRKYNFAYFFNDAKKLVKELHPGDVESCPKVGIRPQLVDTRTNELVMDFLVEHDERSVHILNSISPAFTGSMFFAEMIVNQYV